MDRPGSANGEPRGGFMGRLTSGTLAEVESLDLRVGPSPRREPVERPELGRGVEQNEQRGRRGAVVLSGLRLHGSPPPAPSPEASSEGNALEPAVVSTQPAPTSAQASPSPLSSSLSAAADLRRELSALPENVLVGTDVVPLADYLALTVPVPQNGAFRSEQGGATAEVRIVPGANGITLTREFMEPGMEKQTKRYNGLQARANGVRLSSANLEVLGMQQSLLVLEKHSGVDGIPDSLWIEYERPGARSPAKGE